MAAPSSFPLVRLSRSRDFRIVQGSTFRQRLQFDADWGADWTGFAARAQLRRNVRDSFPETVVATMTATIVDPLARIVDIYMSPETTEAIKERRGTWDVEIFNGVDTYCVLRDVWELNRETTQ